MDLNLTEDEQVEQLKKWWSENGRSIIAGLIIGVGGLFGWRAYVDYQNQVSADASSQYEQVLVQLKAGNYSASINNAQDVVDDFGGTAYASLARLALAKAYVETADFEQAKAALKAAVDAEGQSEVSWVARKRLAVVHAQLAEYDQAMSLLDVEYPVAFRAAYEELKGDIYAAQGKKDIARIAYQNAKLSTPPAANAQFLQQKMDDLGFAK